MRVAFIGKGGSGKTTVTGAFSRFIADKVGKVLAFDVDVNCHLSTALGLKNLPKLLIPAAKSVFTYLEPSRPELSNSLGEIPFIGCLPPSSNSRFININDEDPFLKEFATEENGIVALAAGTYLEADIGSSCYHGKLFSSQLVAHRLLDTDEIVTFDATAGTDPVATSLFLAYDLHVVVVEPTLKSIKVYNDYLRALPLDTKVVAVLNKIRNLKDIEFVKQHIKESEIVGVLSYSPDVRAFEQGDIDGMSRFTKTNSDVFEQILNQLRSCRRDRATYYQSLQSWFEKYSAKWYDPVYDSQLGAMTRDSTWNSPEASN